MRCVTSVISTVSNILAGGRAVTRFRFPSAGAACNGETPNAAHESRQVRCGDTSPTLTLAGVPSRSAERSTRGTSLTVTVRAISSMAMACWDGVRTVVMNAVGLERERVTVRVVLTKCAVHRVTHAPDQGRQRKRRA